jgi:hypothetical protein
MAGRIHCSSSVGSSIPVQPHSARSGKHMRHGSGIVVCTVAGVPLRASKHPMSWTSVDHTLGRFRA